MMCARGSTSQSTRIASSIATCAARIERRVRRSCRSQVRYCALGDAGASEVLAVSTFDMDFELLPQGIEVAVDLRCVARRERSRAAAVRAGEPDHMVGLHATRP